MDSLSPDGEAEAFTSAFFASIIGKARLAALALLLFGAILFVFRRAIADSLFARAAAASRYAERLYGRAARSLSADPAHAWTLIALLVAGAALRMRWLDQPINYDESFTYITYVSRPALVGLSDYGYLNNHLLHTLLAHAATEVFGNAPWALRLPAFLAGCALIPLSYALAARLGNTTAGVLAASLVATNPVLMEFSACARGYSIVTACFLVVAVIACDLIEGDDEGAWTCLAIAAAAGFFAVPVFVYPFGVVMLWTLLARMAERGGRLDTLRSFVVTGAITAALVALAYALPLGISGVPERWQFTAPPQPFGAFLASLPHTLRSRWADLARGMPPVLLATVFVGAALSVRAARAGLLVVSVAVCLGGALAAQRIMAPARGWLFVLPLIFALAGAGWAGILGRLRGAPRVLAPAAAATLVVAAFITQPPLFDETDEPQERMMKLDSEAIALYLGETLEAGDTVVSGFPLDYPIEYYVRRHRLPYSVLRRPSAGASRYLIVANDALGETVGRVLAKAAVDRAGSSPTLLRAFTYASLYEMKVTR